MRTKGKGAAIALSVLLIAAGHGSAQQPDVAGTPSPRARLARGPGAPCIRPDELGLRIPAGSRDPRGGEAKFLADPVAQAIKTSIGVPPDHTVLLISPPPHDRVTIVVISSQGCVGMVEHTTLAALFAIAATGATQGDRRSPREESMSNPRPRGFPRRSRETTPEK